MPARSVLPPPASGRDHPGRVFRIAGGGVRPRPGTGMSSGPPPGAGVRKPASGAGGERRSGAHRSPCAGDLPFELPLTSVQFPPAPHPGGVRPAELLDARQSTGRKLGVDLGRIPGMVVLDHCLSSTNVSRRQGMRGDERINSLELLLQRDHVSHNDRSCRNPRWSSAQRSPPRHGDEARARRAEDLALRYFRAPRAGDRVTAPITHGGDRSR